MVYVLSGSRKLDTDNGGTRGSADRSSADRSRTDRVGAVVHSRTGRQGGGLPVTLNTLGVRVVGRPAGGHDPGSGGQLGM